MKLKVCGMTDVANINEIVRINPDYLGFIFNESSPRNVILTSDFKQSLKDLDLNKVGVFVNEELSFIKEKVEELEIDFVQLHGDENTSFCREVQCFVKVIRVFKVDDEFDFDETEQFHFVDLFLFDTKGLKPGGNGTKFNWERLSQYKLDVPFLLSGGIHLSDIVNIKSLNFKQLIGVDVNSGFEIEPGIKNKLLISELKEELSNV